MKWFLLVLTFSLCVYAQQPAVVEQPAPQVAAQSGGEKVLGVLSEVNDKVPSQLPEKAVGGIVLLLTLLVRVYPTASKWCLIFTPISAGLGLLVSIFSKLKSLSDSVIEVFNKVK